MINFETLNSLQIPEGTVKCITRKKNGKVLWEKKNTNQVFKSINSDGTIYNGKGYKDGYRIRSGGAEASYGNAACTGFIKVNAGDVIRLSGWDFSVAQNGNAINVSNTGFNNIGQFTTLGASYGIFAEGYSAYSHASVVKEQEGVWKWVVPPAASGVAYIRITGYSTSGAPGAKMLITINEEII